MPESLRRRGFCHVFGDRFPLDEGIMPFRLAIERVTAPDQLIPHLFATTDPGFASRVKRGDFIIAGADFACGKVHDQGFIAMAALELCVLCGSMPYKAMRRAVSRGLPVLAGCGDAAQFVRGGDELEVDFATGVARNLTTGQSTQFPPMPPILLEIALRGGINGVLAAWLAAHPEQAGPPHAGLGKGIGAIPVVQAGASA